MLRNMKKYLMLINTTVLKLINQKNKLMSIRKRRFLNRNSFLYNRLAFFLKYLLNIKIIYDFTFEKIIEFDYENVKSLFSKAKLANIREYAYIRYYLEKFNRYHELYNIPGTKNISGLKFYNDPNIYPNFQKDLERLES